MKEGNQRGNDKIEIRERLCNCTGHGRFARGNIHRHGRTGLTVCGAAITTGTVAGTATVIDCKS